MTNVFEKEVPFFKGNLHTHTSISDGKVTPEECIELYKKNGYDFLAITDHRKRFPGYEDEKILVVPAAEYDVNVLSGRPEYAYHITGVGLSKHLPQEKGMTPQQIVDMIKEDGAFCTLAHPIWSLMDFTMLEELKGYDAIEVYNTVSDVYSGRGYSDIYIDMMACRGIYKLITAVDDTHFYDRDACKGYICVQAEERTWPAICDSLMKGKFYASQGPSIFQISYDDKKVTVDMSPVDNVRFMGNELYDGGRTVYAEEASLTHAEYKWGSYDRYTRIEVRDAQGNIAWSNIIVRPNWS